MIDFVLPRIKIGIKLSKHGKVIKEYEEDGHSWTRNAYLLFLGLIADCSGDDSEEVGKGNLCAKAVDETLSSDPDYPVWTGFASSHSLAAYRAGGTQDTGGIVLGTGDTPFDIDDYKLEAQIYHGDNAGQLYYWADLHYNDGTVHWLSETEEWRATRKRLFKNNSGATITVKEVGLYWSGQFFNSTNKSWLTCRDILETPLDIENDEEAEITYFFYMDFSPIE